MIEKNTDTTIFNYPNQETDLSHKWKIENSEKKWFWKNTKNIGPAKTSSATGNPGTISLPRIADSLTYIETSSINSGSERVFCCFEGSGKIQVTNRTFSYARFSFLTNNSKKIDGRLQD